MEFGRYGIWSGSFRGSNRDKVSAAARQLEQMGYSSLWVPGGADDAVLEFADAMLAGTDSAIVATGILNIWQHDPAAVAATHAQLNKAHAGRFMLGLGVGHAASINAQVPGRYRQPLTAMATFLDGLDAGVPPVPRDERMVAALAPKMLELSLTRSAGTHPYHMPIAHTAYARQMLGPDALVIPEQAVVLETDLVVARAIARESLTNYARLPNYVNNWVRFGFNTETDIVDGRVSDRLVDALVACGSAEQIADRCAAQLGAGADSVCIQVLTASGGGRPFDQWEVIANALDF